MSGWARHEGLVYGLFIQDMQPAGGVAAQDMPAGRPKQKPKPKIKGVPMVSGSHPDYVPGQGTWRPV